MKRIAILGGGIAGVAAAYECARQQQAGVRVAFTLFEATHRLGGSVETEHRDGFVVECGPDGWVTEKPWARALAVELGLESEIIHSQDAHRKTYLSKESTLHPMPDGMSMMVPFEWTGVLSSPLLSRQAKLDYLREPRQAAQLKATALDRVNPPRDESVKSFIVRHFGMEAADTMAAPLLAGVFGGDIATLSVRAVLPTYVALEREYGSLILGLQQKMRHAISPAPIFSSLRNGLTGLIEGMELQIADRNIRRGFAVETIERIDRGWQIHGSCKQVEKHETAGPFEAIVVATPAKATARLLAPLDRRMAELLPQESSSSLAIALGFSAQQSQFLRIPPGFGFLVSHEGRGEPALDSDLKTQALLACTFVHQKFPCRTPDGAVLLRGFFGGPSISALLEQDDATLCDLGHAALQDILGNLPEPLFALVRRWPDALALYSVGHPDRIAELESRTAQFPNMRLIGNSYRGVGLPDLIRDGRQAARDTIAALAG